MIIKGHAPGTILQFLFIKERLRSLKKERMSFIEVGSGKGYLSQLLLSEGHTGIGVDLNKAACDFNRELNEMYISKGDYEVNNSDFNTIEKNHFDFLISSLVIEHLNEDELNLFIEKGKNLIRKGGRLIFLVPSNMMAWGIEDEIAGHVKRYSFEDIDLLAKTHNMKSEVAVGLNYPISNWFLRLSNIIVNKNEGYLVSKSKKDRTVYTGNRNVKYKTIYPKLLNIILNEYALFPLHIIQKSFSNNKNSLIMYFELTFNQ